MDRVYRISPVSNDPTNFTNLLNPLSLRILEKLNFTKFISAYFRRKVQIQNFATDIQLCCLPQFDYEEQI